MDATTEGVRRQTFTVPEVAEILGVSRATGYEIARRADFPAVRVSERRIVVPKEAFWRWLRNQAG